ncbi:MAG: HAD family phosphatase [Candidatus Schekmanbacteria bacterium]|nr:HAD family phosphatase [Candidatus Schekmanbacteria bacterium]
MPTAPRVLLFDLGGVLIELDAFARLQAICPDSPGEDCIRIRWLASPALRAFELGRIGADEFARQFVCEWRLPWSPERFLREFEHWPRALYPGAETLLLALRARYRVCCLTNSNELHLAARPELGTLFDDLFSSHRLGLVKPDPAIFHRVVELLGVPAEAIVFFDDAPPNVESASRVGLQAHHVMGFPALAARVAELALLA